MSELLPHSQLKGVSNRRLALQIIREEGPISRAEIARRLHLSRPTASRIVDVLEQAGLITATGKSQPTGGRLGELYSLRDGAGFVLALELGTREARLAIANLNGEIVSRTFRSLLLETRESVLPQLGTLVTDAIQPFSEFTAPILSIGVAVPGVVHMKPVPGYVDAAKVFRGLNDRPLQSELEAFFHVPVAMENDVNLAAVGECQFGCAQGYRNVVYLFVGRGIGAGLVLEGNLFSGTAQAAGEVGNMIIGPANLYQKPGPRGYLESLVSIDQLVEVAQNSESPSASVEAFCEQAFSGEKRATIAIHTMNEYLSVAIVNLVAVVDPEIVVLGGDLAELPHAEELFVRPIEQLIRYHVSDILQIRLSQLQGDAALYGAIEAAINTALNAEGSTGIAIQDMLHVLSKTIEVAG